MLRADDHAGINEDSVSTHTRHPPGPTPASSSTAASSKARAPPAKRAKASTSSSNSNSMSPGVLAAAAAAAAAAAENNVNDDGFYDDEGDDNAETSAAAVARANNSSAMTKEEAALADRRRRNRETQRAIRKKKAARLQDAEVRATVFETEIEKLKLRLREVELERANLQRELDDWKSGRLQLASTAAAAAVTSGAATASSGTPAGASPRPLPSAARHRDSYALPHHQERHMEVDYQYSHPPSASDERGFPPQGPYHGYGPPRHHPHPHHAHPAHGHHYYDMHARPGYDPAYHNYYVPRYPSYDPAQSTAPGAAASPQPPLSAVSSQPAARYADHPAGHQHHAHRHRESSFSGARDTNDRSVLGKRKSVDQHSPNLPPPPPPAAAASGPDIAVRSPSAVQSPSVLQPLSDVAAIHSASPASYSQEMHDIPYGKAEGVDTTHLSALDTAGSNEDGSGGSNPSPSSAGTIRPGYSTAFGHPTALGEAVAAARAFEPRSNSMASSSASASASISDASGSKRPSYDDYHDFWTSSASQSQSDSHTSLSSYSRTTSSMQERDRLHASVAGLGPPKEGGGSNTLADGMILSMSRSSLCASPLSIAHASPTGEEEELADAEGRAVRLAAQDEESRNSPSLAPRAPMLPSLASSLEPTQHDKERPVSLPPLSSVVPAATSPYPAQASPRSLQSLSLRHATSPALVHTGLPVQSSPLRGEEDRPRYAYTSKPLLTTRNGRGKSTSYPVVGTETIFEGQEASHRAVDSQAYHPQHGRAGSQGQQFHWPSIVHERYYERTQGPPEHKSSVNPYGELPSHPASTSIQAAMKPPVSSTRGEPDASPPPNISPSNAESTRVDDVNKAGPVPAASASSAVALAEDKTLKRGNNTEVEPSTTGHTERGKPQRRRSTYEDFVELFGSQNAPVLD